MCKSIIFREDWNMKWSEKYKKLEGNCFGEAEPGSCIKNWAKGSFRGQKVWVIDEVQLKSVMTLGLLLPTGGWGARQAAEEPRTSQCIKRLPERGERLGLGCALSARAPVCLGGDSGDLFWGFRDLGTWRSVVFLCGAGIGDAEWVRNATCTVTSDSVFCYCQEPSLPPEEKAGGLGPAEL